MTTRTGLPGGFRLVVTSPPRIVGERALLGGEPLRLLRLSAAGFTAWNELAAGVPVRAAGPGAGLLARRLVDGGFADAVPPAGGTADGCRTLDVTVVVPVRDRSADLARLLASVGPCGGVVVVDDGSADDSGAVARAAGARVVRREVAGGPAVARLAGLAEVTTPLVAFLDSDVVPSPGWLERLLPWFADPACAAVAPRVVSRPGPSLLERYEQVRSPLDLGPRGGPVAPGRRLSYVPFAALVIRRDAAAGMDPGLRFGEDVDLVWRLVAAGWTVRYEPTAVVRHRPREGWAGAARQRFSYGSAAGPLSRRHPAELRPLRGVGVGAAGIAAGALSGSPVPVAVAAGVTAVRLRRRLADLPRPGRLALLLTARGQRAAASQVAQVARREWLPLAAATRSGRWGVVAAVVLPAAAEWGERRPDVPLPWYVLARAGDDAAYAAGVWWGCLRSGTVRPLLPPGRLPRLPLDR